MIKKGINIKGANVLMLGITFKENCPDIRNIKVVDVYRELKEYGVNVDIYELWADQEKVMHEYGVKVLNKLPDATYDAIILAVVHKEFLKLDINKLKNDQAVVYDIMACLDQHLLDASF